MKTEDLDRWVRAKAKSLKPKLSPAESKHRHGGRSLAKYVSQLDFLGLSVPQQRELAKQEVAKELSIIELLKAFPKLNTYETKQVLMIALESSSKPNQFDAAIFLEDADQWAKSIDCWPLADGFCKLMNICLSLDPQATWRLLKKWHASKLPWLNRMAIVSLFYYFKKGSAAPLQFQEALAWILTFSKSEHLYVQKGVGWQLRELGNAFPKEYLAWALRDAHTLSPAAFQSALEKLDSKSKEVIRARRKNLKP
jgi:3-methyladenine DNA glycosylase AlkD